jgi:hypothetical protein
MSKCRFRLFDFFVNMWRAYEWPRLIFPVAVSRTRLAVPLCVFSFGIITPKCFQFPFSNRQFIADSEIPLSSIDSSPVGVGVNMSSSAIMSYSAALDGSGAASAALGAAGSVLTAAGAAFGVAGSDFPAVLCRFGPRIINI